MLIEAAKTNRWGQRNSTMILMAFRHGLRASELCGLQWSDVEFESGSLHLRRAKGGAASTHPLLGDELRALRVLKREAKSPFVFVSERGAPFSTSGWAKLIERAGVEAKMPFPVHPHMLRHACGFVLANKGTDTRTLASLSRPPLYPIDGALHRASARSVQEPVAVKPRSAICRLSLRPAPWHPPKPRAERSRRCPTKFSTQAF